MLTAPAYMQSARKRPVIDRRTVKVENLCLALAQLADEVKVESQERTGTCTLVFEVETQRLEQALQRVRGE